MCVCTHIPACVLAYICEYIQSREPSAMITCINYSKPMITVLLMVHDTGALARLIFHPTDHQGSRRPGKQRSCANWRCHFMGLYRRIMLLTRFPTFSSLWGRGVDSLAGFSKFFASICENSTKQYTSRPGSGDMIVLIRPYIQNPNIK